MNSTETHLRRELGLLQTTAINMIDMVGIGPFVVIPLVIKMMAGPQAIWAWVAGALLAFMDGFVWSELGAKMPHAGGSFVFLRETYGRERWGKLMSFLFIWQTIIQAPLVVASGAIGFAQYFTYLVPLDPWQKKLVSGTLVLLLTALLYRKISSVGKLSVFLWVGVIATILWMIFGGVSHFDVSVNFTGQGYLPDWSSMIFWALLGQAMVKTVYSYLGYYNVCHLGAEVREPESIIPKSIFLSITGIAILYLAMNMSVLGVIPWQEAQNSEFIMSTFIERIYGQGAARFATLMVLWIAFASLFSVVLGYSRVPYAAAQDGSFFSVFGRLHPTKNFPHISLLVLGGVGFVFSLLFRLSDVISAILAMRIVIQFIGQTLGLILMRRREGSGSFPFRMWLYPLPAIFSVLAWIGLFYSTKSFALGGLAMIVLGTLVYLVRARLRGEFPFEKIAA